jgi:calcineurin-like phosphoesterase family protein
MDEALIKRWQEMVLSTDLVYHLGDFSFYKPDKTNEILRRLPGQKFLIRGNHDHTKTVKKLKGFAWIKDYYEIKKPHLVILCHYAFHIWKNQQHGSYHLHGHSHGALKPFGKRMDVGVDWLGEDNPLISWNEVDMILKGAETKSGDYHKISLNA